MSKYTTEVRYICETLAGFNESVGYDKFQEVIDGSWDKVFSFDFPIFDTTYKPLLCKKILKHFYTREIGEETYGLWKLRLDTRMNEVMPYFNKLYAMYLDEGINLFDNTNLNKTGNKTEEVDKDGSRNVDTALNRTTEGTANFSEEGSEHRTAENIQRNLYSDTPQNQLSGVENENYLTDARKIKDNIDDGTDTDRSGSSSTTGLDNSNGSEDSVYDENINTTADYLEHIFGKSGGETYAELFMKYKNAFLDVDLMVIDSLNDLFMNIW